MKKHLVFLSALLLAACSHGPADVAGTTTAQRTVEEVAITEGEPMATADLTISGMTCSMMCGNMVKGALAKVPGVTKAEVNYTDGAELGHALVTYDPAQVDDAQLVKAVRALADGQYNVPAIAIRKEVKHSPSASHAAKQEQDERSASLLPEVPMPNLVGLLRALVRI